MRAFAAFEAEPGMKFDKLYEVYSQRFFKHDLEGDAVFDPNVLPTQYLTDPGKGETFVASAIPAFLAETREVLGMKNGEIVTVTPESARIVDVDGTPVEREDSEQRAQGPQTAAASTAIARCTQPQEAQPQVRRGESTQPRAGQGGERCPSCHRSGGRDASAP